MQIKYLPHALYKSYNYACSQTIKDEQIKQRQKYLGNWETLKARKVPDKEIAAITGISRATYYRYKKLLQLHGVKGLEQQSKRPKNFRQSKIPLAIRQAVLNIRRQNPTYGKDKIVIILKRDFAIKLSVSSVGRLIKNSRLMELLLLRVLDSNNVASGFLKAMLSLGNMALRLRNQDN